MKLDRKFFKPYFEFIESPIPAKIIKTLGTPASISLIVGIAVSICVLSIRDFGAMENLELAGLDMHMQMAPVAPEDPRIVIIEITEEDIQTQRQWPISDGVMVQLLKKLVDLKPRVIGIDLYRDIPVPPGNELLNKFLVENEQIYGVMKLGSQYSRKVNPPKALVGSDRVGFNDIIPDYSGIVRRGLLYQQSNDEEARNYKSFSLLLALKYLEVDGIYPEPDDLIPEYIKLGDVTFNIFHSNDGAYIDADDAGYQIMLDYRGGPFRKFSLNDIFEDKIPQELIEDKIAIIGVTAESVPDNFYTPFSDGSDGHHGIDGVEMHSYVTSQFLRAAIEGDPPLLSIGDTLEWIYIIAWGLIGGALGHLVRSPIRFSLLAIVGISIIWGWGQYSFQCDVWVPTFAPMISWLLSAGLVTAYMSNLEKADRALLMQIFSKHVSSDVAEDIWRHRDHFLEGGRPKPQKLTTTVLFTDLQGFTSISERVEPSDLIDWLNEYMEVMTHIVISNHGVINKYIGDAIMAIFGAPLARTTQEEIRDDAINAVNCAILMSKELDKLNASWNERGLPTTKMRVGIFTGPLVAGSLGGADRLEYTVIGDTVNTASRLESFEKTLPSTRNEKASCRILIGEATLNLIGDKFKVKKVGEVPIIGKEKKIFVYRVLGSMNDTGTTTLE